MANEQPDQARQRRTPTREKLLESSPWLPPAFDIADASALQALQRGEANPEQQLRGLTWIINKACATYDFAYRPGANDGERDTLIALGRQFVGQQIVKLLNAPLSMMRRTEPRADPHDPTS